MDKVFVDTDIILDLLTMREPFYTPAALLFSKADRKEIELFVSALSFANLNYILSRHYTAVKARNLLLKFKTLVTVLPIDDKVLDLAFSSDFKDFEDAIQYFASLEKGLTVILTRNIKDYKTATINIMTPAQYLKGI